MKELVLNKFVLIKSWAILVLVLMLLVPFDVVGFSYFVPVLCGFLRRKTVGNYPLGYRSMCICKSFCGKLTIRHNKVLLPCCCISSWVSTLDNHIHVYTLTLTFRLIKTIVLRNGNNHFVLFYGTLYKQKKNRNHLNGFKTLWHCFHCGFSVIHSTE